MAEAQPLALFACYLIVHPLRAENEVRARHHLHCAGIQAITVVRGSLPVGLSVNDRDAAIARSHHRCITHFLAHHGDRDKHLLLCEDDVVFAPDVNPTEVVHDAILKLAQHAPYWRTLHVGHIPCCPTLPVLFSRKLCVSPAPGTAHAILWNRAYLRALHASLPMCAWRRPRVMEFQTALPWYAKFALVHSIASQNQRPKELQTIDNWSLGISELLHYDDIATLLGLVAALLLPMALVACVVLFPRARARR